MSYLFLQLTALFAIIVRVGAAFVRVVDPGEAIDHAYTLLPIMVDVGGGRMEAGEALLSSFGGGVVLMLADKNRAIGWDDVPPPIPTKADLQRPSSTPVTDGDMLHPAVWWRRDGARKRSLFGGCWPSWCIAGGAEKWLLHRRTWGKIPSK
jgi:hypothetical protein